MGLAESYRALRDGAAAVWLDRDALRIEGPDAVSFVDGQLSQEVASLAIGASVWSLVLEPQGRVDALVRVSRLAVDAMVLDTDQGWGEALATRLRRFNLRVKVDLETVPWACLALRGREASRVTEPSLTALDAAVLPLRGAILGSAPGFDLMGPPGTVGVPDGVRLADPAAFEVARIEQGIPAMGAELTERTIPAEAGIVDATVSFTKGCFTGQELVARIDSRGGNVPRHLRGVVVDARVPGKGESLSVDGHTVGVITSAAAHPSGHGVALAYVHRGVSLPTGATLSGGGMARIEALPLVS